MGDKEKLSVAGYLFMAEQDAELAEAELKKIEYLEARMDYEQPRKLLSVYRKLLQERIFGTPVGTDYLRKLREYLLSCEELQDEEIPTIPLYQNYSGQVRELSRSKMTANLPGAGNGRKENRRDKLFVSVSLNVMLVLAVIAMFVIALKSETPNMLNYKNTITNQYSTWEQELKQRENAIRAKEKELFEQEWKE